MGLYGAHSAKRQFAYSNAPAVRKLDKGPLKMDARRRIKNKVTTAVKTVRKDGTVGWCGTKALKSTETLCCTTAWIDAYAALYAPDVLV